MLIDLDFTSCDIDQDLVFQDEDFKKEARIFKDFYHRLVRNIEGCLTWDQGSFQGMLVRYKKCPGRSRIAYKSEHKHIDLLSILARDIPANTIRFNTEVTKIVRDGENPIRVQVSEGQELEADFVVITCSLGVLKARTETLFEPALPERKLEAIRKLEIGSVDKIFLEFEDAWWAQEDIGTGFAFMFSESGNEKVE